jgi:hypothetical protein
LLQPYTERWSWLRLRKCDPYVFNHQFGFLTEDLHGHDLPGRGVQIAVRADRRVSRQLAPVWPGECSVKTSGCLGAVAVRSSEPARLAAPDRPPQTAVITSALSVQEKSWLAQTARTSVGRSGSRRGCAAGPDPRRRGERNASVYPDEQLAATGGREFG